MTTSASLARDASVSRSLLEPMTVLTPTLLNEGAFSAERINAVISNVSESGWASKADRTVPPMYPADNGKHRVRFSDPPGTYQ
jgi:hypothetical protein